MSTAERSDQSPNIIVCTCDQLRAFEVGCYGHPVVQTPHIDRLAAQGVRFEHAVTNNPVCMPARSCLLSGQHSRTCTGKLMNHTQRGPDGTTILSELPAPHRHELLDPTLAEHFKALGYDTALIGKWHIHPAPQLVGFDHAHYPWVHHRHTGQTFVDTAGDSRVVEGFSVEFEADRVGDYLSEQRDRPFFLFYNISPPHMPLMDAPQTYLTMYAPEDVQLRPNVHIDGRPAHDERWFRIYLWDFLFYQEQLPHTMTLPSGFDLRDLTALYYGLTTWVDDTVGRLMANLRQHGLADNTIVVFLADHGDNLGSHHLFNKGRLIEESIRIPLIFYAPKRWSARVNSAQVAQIIDVMPTLLDLCGGTAPPQVQGRSLADIIKGTREQLADKDAFIETHEGQIGVRTRTHLFGLQLKDDLCTFAEQGGCFFDLRTDPYEQHNLIQTGTQRKIADSLRQRLETWNRQTTWFGAKART